MPSKKNRPLTLKGAIKSFKAYLEGTQKSAHTIKNYLLDLSAFEIFLQDSRPKGGISILSVSRSEIDAFRDEMISKGLRSNTRRRKLLTLSKFLQWMYQRKKVGPQIAQKTLAPLKLERCPACFSMSEFWQAWDSLVLLRPLDLRSQVLLALLGQTGILLSELTQVKWEHFQIQGSEARVHVGGLKSSRDIGITMSLYHLACSLAHESEGTFLFCSPSRVKGLEQALSDRAIELHLKGLERLPCLEKLKPLTPRRIRQSVALFWFETGVDRKEIQRRLGLKSAYSFKFYDEILKSRMQSTSKT